MEPVILASGSPRRQEFFKLLGLPFSVISADIDESLCTHTDPEKLTLELAKRKVEKVLHDLNPPPPWIFGADTVVTINNKILGKPENRNEAAEMIRELSGCQHKVVTSMALYNGRKKIIDCRSASCTVLFSSLNESEINWYLDTNEWQGVAGGYRLQGLASCFISNISGSPSTVVGLPLNEFYVMLKDNGYPYLTVGRLDAEFPSDHLK
ncbi:MAG: Maf family protein [Treponema sp.]|nr:Maf family protein [Treponema sp.]